MSINDTPEIRAIFAGFTIEEVELNYRLSGKVTPARELIIVDVGRAERDVLDALALVLAQELLDLALVVLALVQRDADLAAGAGHRLGEQAGLLALDVEVADLAEVEERS
jgi:hypothetical protein